MLDAGDYIYLPQPLRLRLDQHVASVQQDTPQNSVRLLCIVLSLVKTTISNGLRICLGHSAQPTQQAYNASDFFSLSEQELVEVLASLAAFKK